MDKKFFLAVVVLMIEQWFSAEFVGNTACLFAAAYIIYRILHFLYNRVVLRRRDVPDPMGFD